MALAVLSFGLAACGGGGGGGSTVTPCCNVVATPTPAPTGATSTVTVPAGGGQLIIPPFGGYGGSVNVPAPTSGGGASVTITDQTTLPAGLAALTTIGRRPLSNTPVFYFSLTPSATIVFSPTTPGFTITLPSAPASGQSYFIATYNGTAWVLPGTGPASVSGNTLTFAPTAGTATLTAGVTVWFALYFTASATPTPSPSPSPTPSPTPSPSPSPTPSPTPTPTPTATALAVNSRPLKAGDTWTYGGSTTLTQVFARTAPTPIAITTSQVAQSVSVTGGASFNGQTGLFDVKTIETDTAPLQVTTITTHAFLNSIPSGGGSNLISWGYTSLDSFGESLNVQYGSASAASVLLDRLPEVSGDSWTNTTAERIAENSPGNQSSVRTYAADGTYTDTTTYATAQTASIVEHADGSGTYSVPFFGGSNSTLTFSAPSGGIITVSGFSNGSRSASVWYPLPLKLYAETDQNLGAVAIPGACNVPGGFGTTANALTLNTQRVDTILGSIETLAQTTYVVPTYGAACVVLTDTLTSYYDFSGGAPRIAISSTPVETQTVATTIGLTAALINSRGRIVLADGSAAGWRVANARANFLATVERRRIERQRRIFDAFHRMLRDGGRR